jgi:hypothetical protein
METKLRKFHSNDAIENFIINSNKYETIVTNFINGNKKDCANLMNDIVSLSHFIKYLQFNKYDDNFILKMMINFYNLRE